jgi:hypothetical protein
MGLKENILNASDIKVERVEVPEWGTHVYIRVFSGLDRDNFEKQLTVKPTNIRALFLVKVISDEHGNRIFKDDEAEALGQKNYQVLDRLIDVAQRVNALGTADVDALKKT